MARPSRRAAAPAAISRARPAASLEHTALGPQAPDPAIEALCAEAIAHSLCGVCVNGAHVARAAARLRGTGVLTVATVGFPLGACHRAVTAAEAAQAAADGADEVDMVLRVGALLAGEAAAVTADIAAVVRACAPRPVKVIVEACLLGAADLALACDVSEAGGAAFVKTSTGFSRGGATAADVRAIRARVGARLGIKAAGGIRTAAAARALLDAGATRLGCSASLAILGDASLMLRPRG